MTEVERLKQEIQSLKKEKNAVILAHYYQEGDIQEVADFIGDSLGLSQQAAETDADIIVFAGVHFMAETASILNPDKMVLLPDMDAGCSLADSCPPDEFRAFLDDHEGYKVISYINCSAEIKAMSDVICTSANALKIVSSFPKDEKIIFAPDMNLGHYVSRQTNRKLTLWDGACEVHELFSWEKIQKIKEQYPDAVFIAHPESKPAILAKADFVGSTTAMLNYVKKSKNNTFIIATEAGILHQMSKEVSGKKLIPAPIFEENSCACSECRFMKMNTLQKLYDCLRNEYPKIKVEEKIRRKALLPLERMFELSN